MKIIDKILIVCWIGIVLIGLAVFAAGVDGALRYEP